MAEKTATAPGPAIPRDRQFVHLHLHTEYSLLDGGNRIDRLVARVAELGMTAVGVTDHGNIFGAVAFYQACKEKGVKPILGVEAYVTPPDKPRTDRTYSGGGEGGYHLVLLATDLTGWRNLLVLCSEAYLTGFYYKPRIDRTLLEKHSDGLIAINGHLGSEIGEHLLEYSTTGDKRHWERAVESAQWHDRVFNRSAGVMKSRSDEASPARHPDSAAASLRHSVTSSPRFYIELQHHVAEQIRINPLLVKLARELDLPLVCDNDAHFLREQDHDAHDTLICISTGRNKNEPDRMKYSTELYVKSPEQMRRLVDDESEEIRSAWREACDNTLDIADRCNVELPIGQSHAPMVRVDLPDPASLPKWSDPAYGGDLSAWYKDYCSRFTVKPFKQQPTAEELAEAKAECDRALRLIAEAGVIWRYGPDLGRGLGGAALRAASSSTTREPRHHDLDAVDLSLLESLRNGTAKPTGFVGRDPYPPGEYGAVADLLVKQRDLPHYELPDATYFVSWRTESGVQLSPPERSLVLDELLHFDGDRARVYAACVMPDHVHWIVRPFEGVSLHELTGNVKRFSARSVNQARRAKGSLWQPECFDHIIRDTAWFTKFLLYVLDNPVEEKLSPAAHAYPWTWIHHDVLRQTGTHDSRSEAQEGSPVQKGRGSESRATQIGSQSPPRTEILARLERELKILADKNISAYFLIVWDFVNWGRQNGIPALARGSGVGTMVGYVMGLSNACPVRYGLLFERFTDPDRSEYPDIDIDLCQDGRGNVINHVREKYGHVAQIITFGTLKARAALRDVSRVLAISLPAADRIAKLVPEQLNITIDEALEQEPDFKGLYEGRASSLQKVNDKLGPDQQVTADLARRLIDNARTLEGQARHASVHAAGVIVATRPLYEIVPLYKQSGAEDHEIVTQWDGPTCEKMGLLKMDFLGLRTISVIERAKKLIRETLSEEEIWRAVGRGAEYEEAKRQRGETKSRKSAASSSPHQSISSAHPLDLDRLTYADQTVFEMFRRGDTTGVFQFESGGMRRLLVEMKPDRLEDLIAANALFRPGPMDLIPDYNRRKHGLENVPQVHEIVDRYTAETYGVMVYQEQVMQIVHGLGGIKLRDAYSLIKNISKKKHDKIEKERPRFIEGAQSQGLTRQQAQDLFELILKFAGYGFNKSHSTGYAIVAYQTAYLKTYFPNQYMAAFLTYESAASAVSDWTPYLEDCRRARFIDPATGAVVKVGVEVRPPDINLSGPEFSVVFDEDEPHTAAHGHIRFGLKAIKGAGERAIEEIIKERSNAAKQSRADEDPTFGNNAPAQAALRQADSSPGHSVTPSLRHFSSLFDFCERVLARGPGILNKATIESLIKCGAFDSLHGRENRAAMAASIEQAVSAGQKAAADKASGQGALFGFSDPATPAPGDAPIDSVNSLLAKATPWTEPETLAYEKEALGFYVSSHPLERWRPWAAVFTTSNIAGAKETAQDARVVIAAMVQSVRTLVVKSGRSAGQKMAVITIEDLTGSMDSVMFSDCYARFGHLCEAEKVVFVLGRLDRSRGDAQVLIERLVPIEGVPLQPGRLQLCFDEPRLNGEAPATLARIAGIVRAAAMNGSDTAGGANGLPAGSNGHAPGASAHGSANGKAAAGASSGVIVGPLAKGADAEQPFPVEVVIATPTHAAILSADHRLRVPLRPELVRDLENTLGAGMVRLVNGVWADMSNGQGKPWQKKPRFDDDE